MAKLGDKLEIGGKIFKISLARNGLLRVDHQDHPPGVVPVEIWDEAVAAGELRRELKRLLKRISPRRCTIPL